LGSPQIRNLTGKFIAKWQSGQLLEAVNTQFRSWQTRVLEALYSPQDDTAYWIVESEADRNELPIYHKIPAAKLQDLTKSAPWPPEEDFVNWHRSHGDSTSSHFSTLTDINRTNVDDLEVAWIYSPNKGNRNIQSNPVIADGLLFTPNSANEVVALDPETGREVWKFDPKASFPAKRGMVWWPGDASTPSRLYFPVGSHLVALDAKTGSPSMSFGKNGWVYTGAVGKIAPAIVGNVLIHATVKPAIQGYDIKSGAQLWSTPIREQNPPKRAGGLSTKFLGGRPWGGMAVDAGRKIAYLTTSNPNPVLFGADRPGNNETANSVIAVDVTTGMILWKFQEIAHDLWDLDIGAPPILTKITIDSKSVDVVVAVTKFGNTLVLDRVTGKPIFDFRLRKTPTSKIPGEKTAPYQPDLELPQPFARQEFSLEDVTNIGPANREAVLKQLKDANFGFFVPHIPGTNTVFYGLHGGAQWPGAAVDQQRAIIYVASNNIPNMTTLVDLGVQYDETNFPVTNGRAVYLEYCADCHGQNREGDDTPSLQWLGTRIPKHQVAAIIENGLNAMPPVEDMTETELADLTEYLFTRDKELQGQNKTTGKSFGKFERTQYQKLRDHEGYPGSKPPWGTINAIDLNSGKILWQVPLGEYPELTARGIAKTGTENFGSPLVTRGGVVFVSGTKDRMIRAFHTETGEELWSHQLPFVGSGPPSTYAINGKQFLVVPATGGGTLRLYDEAIEVGDAFVAFRLPTPDQ